MCTSLARAYPIGERFFPQVAQIVVVDRARVGILAFLLWLTIRTPETAQKLITTPPESLARGSVNLERLMMCNR